MAFSGSQTTALQPYGTPGMPRSFTSKAPPPRGGIRFVAGVAFQGGFKRGTFHQGGIHEGVGYQGGFHRGTGAVK